MRNYALNQAEALGAVGFSLATIFANWRARRDVARLKDCDGTILATIGLTPADVAAALRLPLSQNAARALDQMAFRRARAR
jgi:hypothetical protein